MDFVRAWLNYQNTSNREAHSAELSVKWINNNARRIDQPYQVPKLTVVKFMREISIFLQLRISPPKKFVKKVVRNLVVYKFPVTTGHHCDKKNPLGSTPYTLPHINLVT